MSLHRALFLSLAASLGLLLPPGGTASRALASPPGRRAAPGRASESLAPTASHAHTSSSSARHSAHRTTIAHAGRRLGERVTHRGRHHVPGAEIPHAGRRLAERGSLPVGAPSRHAYLVYWRASPDSPWVSYGGSHDRSEAQRVANALALYGGQTFIRSR
jgi:hypothetical protein